MFKGQECVVVCALVHVCVRLSPCMCECVFVNAFAFVRECVRTCVCV